MSLSHEKEKNKEEKKKGETWDQTEIKLVRPYGPTKVINVRQQRDNLAFPQVAFKKPTVIKADVSGQLCFRQAEPRVLKGIPHMTEDYIYLDI